MRTLALGLVLTASVSLALVVTAGCTGKSASTPTPTPQCTPAPAYEMTVVVNGKGGTPGKTAAARFVEGGPLFCSTNLVAAGGTFTLGGQGTVVNPKLEIVLNSESGAAWTYGGGDAHWSFSPYSSGLLSGTDCDAARTWTLPFDAGTAAQSAVTWPLGTACP